MSRLIESAPYLAGKAWAQENVNLLREYFSGTSILTSELRVRLFREAEKFYPAKRGDIQGDVDQIAWVAGALYPLMSLLEKSPKGLAALYETAQDMGQLWSVTRASQEALRGLRAKPESWWEDLHGAAAPQQIVDALAINWMRRFSKERGHREPTRWEILIDTMGARELWILTNLETIRIERNGIYVTFEVETPNESMSIIAQDAREKGRLLQGAGEIVG